MRRLLWILIASPLLLTSSAFGWGCEGHQMVALIARAHLNPAVSAVVDDLLRANPIDPALKRFCQDRPGDLMADSATWADDSKSEEKTAEWHFINIPRGVKMATSVEPWCPPIGPSVDGKNRPGCITNAIEYELDILRNKSRASADRAKALRYVIHFLGDIHQPLHDVDEAGGNCTVIQFFNEEKPVNLHAIWDYKLIEHRLDSEKTTQPAYAAALDKGFATRFEALAPEKANDPAAWAWEAHAVAVSITYGDLSPAIPVAAPDSPYVCDTERGKVKALHVAVGEVYFSKAMPAIDEQIATAGYRLAALLNETLR